MIAWNRPLPLRLRLQCGISVLGLSLLVCGCTNSLQRVPIQYAPAVQQVGEDSAKGVAKVESPLPSKMESPQAVKMEPPQAVKMEPPPPSQVESSQPKLSERSDFQAKNDGVVTFAPRPQQAEAKKQPESSRSSDSEGFFTGWYRNTKDKVAGLFASTPSAERVGGEDIPKSGQPAPLMDATKGDGETVHKPMSDETTLGDHSLRGGLMKEEKMAPDAAAILPSDSIMAKGMAERIDQPVDFGDAPANPLEAAPWQTGSGSVNVGKGYYVTMGQFSDYVESEKMVKRMKVLNVPYLQQQSRADGVPVYRVYVGPFADFDEAQAMAKDLQKHDIKTGPVTNKLE
ncbi:MAG: SPOR domain-containing protein [Magnetococcales bacterium]|nr:SPOR domain-containing protein [Magnetococcales bacterium]